MVVLSTYSESPMGIKMGLLIGYLLLSKTHFDPKLCLHLIKIYLTVLCMVYISLFIAARVAESWQQMCSIHSTV